MPEMPAPMTAMFFWMAKLPCIVRPSAGSAGHARLSLTHRTSRLRLAASVRSPVLAGIGLPATDPSGCAGRTRGHACRKRSTLAQIDLALDLALRPIGPALIRHAA